jgi:nickel-type superoxide dismutase maturation protease
MLLRKFKILGHSMIPTIKEKEEVLVSSLFYILAKPKINDIVAVRYKNKILIKRIKKVIDNRYFISGDNKIDSLDSSSFGFVNKEDIIGKVFYKF